MRYSKSVSLSILACVVGFFGIGLQAWNDRPKEDACDRSEEIIVITGTSSGLGLSMKEALIKEGYSVLGASRREGIDLVNGGSAELKKRLAASKKKLIGLINNAGAYNYHAPDDMDDASYISQLVHGYIYQDYTADEMINTRAVINVTGSLLPELLVGAKTCGSATIINVGSISGVMATTDCLSYATTKGAIEMWTDALRRTLRKHSVRVTALQPGFVTSAMCQQKYCEPAERSCLPSVLHAITARSPRERYPCAMSMRTTGTFMPISWIFWLQKHFSANFIDYFVPDGFPA